MLGWLLRSAIKAFLSENRSPEEIGEEGEKIVSRVLRSALAGKEYHILDDLMLPVSNRTTQIDHVVLSPFGIFVVETKNISGWIFGNADQRTWTQVLHRKKYKFHNPIWQNHGHVKVVQSLLGVEEQYVYNVVAFVGSAEAKTAMPSNVAWGMADLGRLVGSRNNRVFSSEEVADFERKIKHASLENSRSQKREHIRNVEQAVSEKRLNPNACPKCGSELVPRQNKI